MQLRAFLVPPDRLGTVWSFVRPRLAACDARSGGYFNTDEYRAGILSGYYRLYHLRAGSGVGWLLLSANDNGKTRYLSVDAVSGRGLLPVMGAISKFCERIARENTCTALICLGRRGLLPALREAGWHEVQRVYAKEVQ